MEPEISYTKLCIRHLLLILAGAVPLALIWNVQNKWIAAPVSILSVLFILAQLSIINTIADRQLAYEHSKKTEAEGHLPPASARKQKVIYNSFLFTFCCLTFLISITGMKMESYLEWETIFVDALKLIWVPVVLSWWYHKRWRVIFEDKDKQTYVELYSFTIPLLLLFHGLVWYNHFQASDLVATEKAVVYKAGSNQQVSYIPLTVDGKQMQFKVPRNMQKEVQMGDMLMATVKKGGLGYLYMERLQRLSQ